MATNLFAGNPPPNVVKWIEENAKSSGWNFDLAKTEYADVNVVGGSTQIQYLVGSFTKGDGSFCLATCNWLNKNYASINTISESNGYHVTNIDIKKGYNYPSSTHPKFKCMSYDGLNAFWCKNDSNTTTIVQQKLATPGDFDNIVETIESTVEITFPNFQSHVCVSVNGKYLFFTKVLNYQTTDAKLIVIRYEMTTPYDILTLKTDSIIENQIAQYGDSYYGTFNGMAISEDGKTAVFNLQDNSCQSIFVKIILSTPYDFSTATVHSYINTTKDLQGIAISPDANTLFASCNGGYSGKIYEFNLSK